MPEIYAYVTYVTLFANDTKNENAIEHFFFTIVIIRLQNDLQSNFYFFFAKLSLTFLPRKIDQYCFYAFT